MLSNIVPIITHLTKSVHTYRNTIKISCNVSSLITCTFQLRLKRLICFCEVHVTPEEIWNLSWYINESSHIYRSWFLVHIPANSLLFKLLISLKVHVNSVSILVYLCKCIMKKVPKNQYLQCLNVFSPNLNSCHFHNFRRWCDRPLAPLLNMGLIYKFTARYDAGLGGKKDESYIMPFPVNNNKNNITFQ